MPNIDILEMADGAIQYPDHKFTVYPPALVSLAVCNRCGFAFDAVHGGPDVGYSCPDCKPGLPDNMVLVLYRMFARESQLFDCYSPPQNIELVVREFREWLVRWPDPTEDYEEAVLKEYRRQEEGSL